MSEALSFSDIPPVPFESHCPRDRERNFLATPDLLSPYPD